MPTRVKLIWWLTCILWSSVWIFIKLGVTDVPPITFAGLRLVIALLLLSPFVWRTRHNLHLTRSQYLRIAMTGLLLLGVNYALVFWGAQFIASGTTAMLQASTPAFSILMTAALQRARIDPKQFAGAVVGVAGVGIISLDQLKFDGRSATVGSLAVVGGAVCVAAAYTLMKAHLDDVPPQVILTGQMLVAAIPLLIAGSITEGNPLTIEWTRRSLIALFYLATVGSVAAFWLNIWLLRRTTATAVVAMSIVEPLLAVALGAFVLGEKLHTFTAAGALLILISTRAVVFRKNDAT